MRPKSLAPSPEEERKDATVRVVFLGSSGEAIVGRLASARSDGSAEQEAMHEEALRIAQEARRAVPTTLQPNASLPKFAIAALLVLLLAGLSAFVVTLLRVR